MRKNLINILETYQKQKKIFGLFGEPTHKTLVGKALEMIKDPRAESISTTALAMTLYMLVVPTGSEKLATALERLLLEALGVNQHEWNAYQRARKASPLNDKAFTVRVLQQMGQNIVEIEIKNPIKTAYEKICKHDEAKSFTNFHQTLSGEKNKEVIMEMELSEMKKITSLTVL